MSAEPTPLAHRLQAMLTAHGVASELVDGTLYLPSVERRANLWMVQTGPTTWRMALRATAVGGEVVADAWAAVGASPAAAAEDGLAAFARSGFPVALAALWGVLDRDRVDREVRAIAGVDWDLYLGPFTGRALAGTPPLAAPAGLAAAVLRAFDTHLTWGETHALRLYVAGLDGAPTLEALVDGAASPAVAAAVAAADWVLPERGFAALRWFVIARRRTRPGPA